MKTRYYSPFSRGNVLFSGLVLSLACLLLMGFSLPYMTAINQKVLELSQQVLPRVMIADTLAVVLVPEDEAQLLSVSPAGAIATQTLLASYDKSQAFSLLLAMPVTALPADSLLSQFDGPIVSLQGAEIEVYQQRQRFFNEFYRRDNVILGLMAKPEEHVYADSAFYLLWQWLQSPSMAWAVESDAQELELELEPITAGKNRYFYHLGKWGVDYPLVHQTLDGLPHIAMVVAMREQIKKPALAGDRNAAIWQIPAPVIQPLLVEDDAAQLGVTVLSLEQALAHPPTAPMILLASASNPFVADITSGFISPSQGQFTQQTPFLQVLSALLIMAITLFALVLMKRLSWLSTILFGVLLVIALLALQWYFIWHQKQWLPLADHQLFVLFICVLILVIRRLQKPYRQQRSALARNAYQLAEFYLKDNQLDQAFYQMRHHGLGDKRYLMMYDIARAYERQRQYEQALKVYGMIRGRHKNFKDISARQKQLKQLKQQADGDDSGVDLFAKTQPILLQDGVIEKPKLGRYQIERELGRGGNGVVYLGYDPKIARKVAIKTLSYEQFSSDDLEQVKQRFYREAEAAGRLNHPGIITVYDIGEERDMAYIAMDYIAGKSLDEFVGKKHLLAVDKVYALMADVADALEYAHKQNIVHRDIKPSNLMLDEQTQQVKIADFGIARLLDDSRTRTGHVLGSPVYMSPEQLAGKKVDGRADVYSLGVSFYQLLTASLPFEADTMANLTYQILHKKPISVRKIRAELPASATRIINKALNKEAAKRFATAAEMADALRKAHKKDF